jgi:hypothetical protein
MGKRNKTTTRAPRAIFIALLVLFGKVGAVLTESGRAPSSRM